MGLPPPGSVVVVRFPFSDLSPSKPRPAVVLADVGFDDLILCQVTSNAFSDPSAIEIGIDDFDMGALRKTSFARPGKLFTANSSLISSIAGSLDKNKFHEIIDAIIHLLRASQQS